MRRSPDARPLGGLTGAMLVVSLSLVAVNAGAAGGDAARGKREFAKCLFCHSTDPAIHKAGPSLASIWGRKAGTAEGFGRYSAALRNADVVWTAATLDRWLQGPRALIPGTKMVDLRITSPVDRRDLIAYLRSLGSAGRGPQTTAKPTDERMRP